VFADFADRDRRLRLFIDGYNFQRPRQGITLPKDLRMAGAPDEVLAKLQEAVTPTPPASRECAETSSAPSKPSSTAA
jgi:hypothetical protein